MSLRSAPRGSVPPVLRPGRRALTVTAAAIACVGVGALPASAEIKDFPVPTSDAGLHDIATGKDGSLWFTEEKKGKVGRITTSGQITEWSVPWDGTYGPEELTVAADGRVWVLSDAHARVFVIDPAVPGQATAGSYVDLTARGGAGDFDDPQPGLRRGNDIAAAPDGSVWVSDSLGDGITRFAPPQASTTAGGTPDCDFDGLLAPGADGKMWCAYKGSALKRIELDGATNVNLPTADGFAFSALAGAPDGAMWFARLSSGTFATKPGNGAIGRMTPDGAAQEWKVGDRVAPSSIAIGPDGAAWFGSKGYDQVIGRVTPAGAVSVLPLGARRADDVAFGGDGALWFVDQNANRITRLTRDELVTGGGGTGGPTPAGGPTVPAGTLRQAKGRIPVRVACPATAAERCRGTFRLRTASKVRVGGRGKKAVRTVTGTGRYTLSPGRTGTIVVKLSATGRKVVRKGRTTKVVVEVTPTGAKKVATKRTVALRG
ncbi:virginiamycin B lyase family protein [Patulibacter minatonensis]|uniref:Vgb family protein n=1 Tax=Patulibacter minatonensis TaxID=298163 RepID=UPI00056D63DD|nr:hypothetical protein [Patulibacter minatonensis]